MTRLLNGIRSVLTARWNFVTLVERRVKIVAILVQLATTSSQREPNVRTQPVNNKTVQCAMKLECLAVTCVVKVSK